MRYRTIFILFSLLAYCGNVNANEHEEQHCRGRPAYYNLNETQGLINVSHDVDYDYCWMIFAPDDDYQVRIKFSHFNLTRGYDFLEIGDRGDDAEVSTNSLLATFSGGNLPNDVISSSRGMWMKLNIKKDIISHRPPNITFSIQAEKRKVDINLPCPTASPYDLTYPTQNVNYSNNGYRLWRVTTELPCVITTMMTSLWLEEGHDFVFMREDDRAPFSRSDWSNFTAQRKPWFLSQYPYRTKGNNLTIIFTSDYSNEKPGFTLQLVANLSDGTIIKDIPSTPTTPPTENQTRTTLSSPLQTIEFRNEGQRNETKSYLLITGIHIIAIAVLVLIIIFAVRCVVSKINTRTAPIPRSGSTTNSLGRFYNSLRRTGETSSGSWSFGMSSSGSFSSGRSRFSSSLYSDYTSSLSSCRSYRISTLFGSHFGKDSLPALRNTPSGSQLTSFHPKISQDKCVVDVFSDGTSSQSEGDNVSRRISWRMIGNAFWNGSSWSPASSFRSTSIQERVTRGSTGSSVLQDSEYVDPMDISCSISSTDSESVPVIRVAQRNSPQPMSDDGQFEAERRGGKPRNQPETLSIEQVDGSEMNQVVERKVSHIYFKGFNRLSSSVKLPNGSDRSLPPIPPRRRHDDNSTSIDTATTGPDDCHPRIQFGTLTREQEISQMGQAVEKKVTHTYFKGFSGLSSRFMLPNVSGRPLPKIPPRHGKMANILTHKHQVPVTNVQFENNEDTRGHQEETLHGYDESTMSSDESVIGSDLKDLYASIKKTKLVKSTFTSNGM
ncbi:uncharacterized protein LOC105447507 [Strongylocentrotus purpuratus]|uniref:CUB domain-containing protein n=1 Tax=Strongylocentrotus purpuratus TaxID=7668 RepID=A0A7M7STP4_STRPU|nr:uncharacterized protein LOC105447507 [Strongylocentrotus purpuratus]